MGARASRPPARTAAEIVEDLRVRWDAFAPLLEGMPAPVVLVDRSGTILRSTAPLGGIEPPGLVGRRLAQLAPPEHAALLDAAIRDAVSPGIGHTVDVPLLGPGGVPRWYLAQTSPARIAGRPEGALVVLADVDARRREEERLRRSEQILIDTQGTAHLGTWEWDVTKPHAVWSPELYRIYDLDPATHVPTYQDYLTRVHPDDRARVVEATEGVFRDHQPYSHDERILRPSGEMRWLHTWAQAVLKPDGSLERLVGVCQDITDRKRAEAQVLEQEEALREAALRVEELESATERNRDVLAVASHELKNPLTPILLQLHLLREGKRGALTPDQERALGTVYNQADRLRRLVQDLLDVARLDRGVAPVRAAPVRVEEVARAVADSLRDVAASGRVTLVEDGDAAAVAYADAERLAQVLANLVGNAVKFTPPGGRIRVSTRADGGEVRVDVEDTGPGLTPEEQANLFRPFARAGSPAAGGPRGSGLGLWIAKRLVDAQDGRLWVDSTPGRGSVFHVALPTQKRP